LSFQAIAVALHGDGVPTQPPAVAQARTVLSIEANLQGYARGTGLGGERPIAGSVSRTGDTNENGNDNSQCSRAHQILPSLIWGIVGPEPAEIKEAFTMPSSRGSASD
jgi:hypothetical protein